MNKLSEKTLDLFRLKHRLEKMIAAIEEALPFYKDKSNKKAWLINRLRECRDEYKGVCDDIAKFNNDNVFKSAS